MAISDSSDIITSTRDKGGTPLMPPHPVIGIVKDVVDNTFSGRLRVYIAGGPNDEDDEGGWKTVNFMSPFFGATLGNAGDSDLGDYTTNPSSYGMWYSPPDIGTSVLCVFVNGDPSKGFWIGCIPTFDALSMVPAIGATDNIVSNDSQSQTMGGSVRLPTTNLNSNNPELARSQQFREAPKPVHSYVAAVMQQQGVLRDPIRGAIGSNAQRETPSRVGWGVSTPGRPIYEGGYNDETIADLKNLDLKNTYNLQVVSRRGGHSIVMDDGDIIGRDQLIRIRTALGHQILMSDDGQCLSILHSNGQSYIELGAEGTIDMYSTNSINMRSQGDINIHADRDVNINGNKNLKINSNGDLEINSTKKTKQCVGTNFNFSCGQLYTVNGGMGLALSSGGVSSIAGSLATFINGKLILMNTGMSPLMPQNVPGSTINTLPDTLFDDQKGFISAPDAIASICSRVPTHYPYAEANKGVDVSVNLGQASGLPDPANAALEAANANAADSIKGLMSGGVNSLVPNVPGISSTFGDQGTNAMLGAMTSLTAQGVNAAAINTGFSISTEGGKRSITLGAFGQTPADLEKSGILKPGTAKQIESLISSGYSPQQAMPDKFFTGKSMGARNFQELIRSYKDQAQSAAGSLQRAQNDLQSAGIITGREDPSKIGGAVVAAATQGTPSVVATLRQTNNAVSQSLAAARQAGVQVNSKVYRAIGTGNLFQSVAENNNGSGNPLSAAIAYAERDPALLGKINNSRGLKGAAYDVAKQALGDWEAGKPVNLSVLAVEKGLKNFSLFSLSPSQQQGIQGIFATQLTNAANTAAKTFFKSTVDSLKRDATLQQSLGAGFNAANNSLTQAYGSATAGGFATLTSLKSQSLMATSSLKAAGMFASNGQWAHASNAIASGLGGIPIVGGFATHINNNLQTAISNIKALPGQIKGIFTAAKDAKASIDFAIKSKELTGVVAGGGGKLSGIFGGPAGGGLSGIGQSLQQGFASVSASIGAAVTTAMNVVNAVASIASLFGGKRKIKKGVSKSNTVNRRGVNSQFINTLGNPQIPPPLFLGGMSDQIQNALAQAKALGQNQASESSQLDPNSVVGDFTAAQGGAGQRVYNNLVPTTKTNIASGQSAITRQQNVAANAYAGYEQVLNNYPQGSIEIQQAKNAYEQTVSPGGAIGIPAEYQGFYNRFRKLPANAQGQIVNGVYVPFNRSGG
jgi:hypothetical protein